MPSTTALPTSSRADAFRNSPECTVDTSDATSLYGIAVSANPFQVLAANNNRSRSEEARAKRISQNIAPGARINRPDHHLGDLDETVVFDSYTGLSSRMTVAQYYKNQAKIGRHAPGTRHTRLRNVRLQQASPFEARA